MNESDKTENIALSSSLAISTDSAKSAVYSSVKTLKVIVWWRLILWGKVQACVNINKSY